MHRFWKHKLITVWIASLAILLSSLMPSMSMAMPMTMNFMAHNAQIDRIISAEICSIGNNFASETFFAHATQDQVDQTNQDRDTNLSSSTNTNTNSGAHASKHCPFCLPHSGNFAMPPALLPCCAIAAGREAFPPLFYQAPTLLFSWVSANPRGPPQKS